MKPLFLLLAAVVLPSCLFAQSAKTEQLQARYNQLEEKLTKTAFTLDSLQQVLLAEENIEKETKLELKDLKQTASILEKNYQPSLNELDKTIQKTRDAKERAALREEKKAAQVDYRAQMKDIQAKSKEADRRLQSADATKARIKTQLGPLQKSVKNMKSELKKLDKEIEKSYELD